MHFIKTKRQNAKPYEVRGPWKFLFSNNSLDILSLSISRFLMTMSFRWWASWHWICKRNCFKVSSFSASNRDLQHSSPLNWLVSWPNLLQFRHIRARSSIWWVLPGMHGVEETLDICWPLALQTKHMNPHLATTCGFFGDDVDAGSVFTTDVGEVVGPRSYGGSVGS